MAELNGRKIKGMDAEEVKRFMDIALLELKRAERYRSFLSLLILNLSEFLATAGRRKINSLEESRQFTVRAVNRLRHGARETDMITNLDDSRLAMILPETDRQGAQCAAVRFHEMITEFMAEFMQSDYHFKIPLEITSFPNSDDEDSLKIKLTNLFAGN
jgi:GGDEF domain-containing protein